VSIALDGVRRAKQRRNQLAIFGMRLQRQKRLLHLREALLGFFPERLQEHSPINFHDSLQDFDYCVSCVRAKNNALPAVHANYRGNDRYLRLR